jgi:predicted outer membrane lipoprotein
MKKLKLIFGLLLVAAFFAITVLSYTSTDSQAISKEDAAKYIPRQG